MPASDIQALRTSLGIETTGYYGVQWDVTNNNPATMRIGSSTLHQTLPVQSKMKGCLLLDNGTVNYYLKPNDWTKKADETASDLTGTDGQVMVEIPAFYWKFETDGNTRRVMLSELPLTGFSLVPKMYVSAYEAALNRTNSKLSSVVNTSADYRGGNNNAAWDAAANSLLGKPATSISRTNYRTYARARGTGWEMYFHLAHKALFWLSIVEFANKNIQLAVNGSLTAEGYRQGGIGVGVTEANPTEWNVFSIYYPFIACGSSNSLANSSGEVSEIITDFGGVGVDRTFTVPRYRGIENPFGHIWKNCDGINVKVQSVADGGESQVWTSDTPATWNDSNYTDYANRGLLPRANGYVSKVLFGLTGEFTPELAAGGSTTFFSDYFNTAIPASGTDLRTLLLGGAAHDGSSAGFGYSGTDGLPSSTGANVGSRLCFLGA